MTDDGGVLVDRAFGGDPPLIAINERRTASEKSEQSGFANLVKGTFGMFRNPTAHEARIHWDMSKADAEDLLSIVSLIHRRLDASHASQGLTSGLSSRPRSALPSSASSKPTVQTGLRDSRDRAYFGE